MIESTKRPQPSAWAADLRGLLKPKAPADKAMEVVNRVMQEMRQEELLRRLSVPTETEKALRATISAQTPSIYQNDFFADWSELSEPSRKMTLSIVADLLLELGSHYPQAYKVLAEQTNYFSKDMESKKYSVRAREIAAQIGISQKTCPRPTSFDDAVRMSHLLHLSSDVEDDQALLALIRERVKGKDSAPELATIARALPSYFLKVAGIVDRVKLAFHARQMSNAEVFEILNISRNTEVFKELLQEWMQASNSGDELETVFQTLDRVVKEPALRDILAAYRCVHLFVQGREDEADRKFLSIGSSSQKKGLLDTYFSLLLKLGDFRSAARILTDSHPQIHLQKNFQAYCIHLTNRFLGAIRSSDDIQLAYRYAAVAVALCELRGDSEMTRQQLGDLAAHFILKFSGYAPLFWQPLSSDRQIFEEKGLCQERLRVQMILMTAICRELANRNLVSLAANYLHMILRAAKTIEDPKRRDIAISNVCFLFLKNGAFDGAQWVIDQASLTDAVKVDLQKRYRDWETNGRPTSPWPIEDVYPLGEPVPRISFTIRA